MSPLRDFQKQRVYDWEDRHIAPRDLTPVPFDQIPHIVHHCWPGPYPPKVEALHKLSRMEGTGHRLRLRFPTDRPTKTWIILHEMAHALTFGDGHGPNFVGAYIHLVEKYLNIPIAFLHYTAKASNVKFNVCPTFNFTGDYL